MLRRDSIRINHYTITPYRVNHSVQAVGYLVEDKKGRRLIYTGDKGPLDSTWKETGANQIHCLIVEVSCLIPQLKLLEGGERIEVSSSKAPKGDQKR